MICVRPKCDRPRDRGVHCRKCHQRFKVRQHNNHHANMRAGFDMWAWPAYTGTNKVGYQEALVDALNVSAPADTSIIETAEVSR